jgi:hypothetical protein
MDKRTGEWTPDEVWLTMEAHLDIAVGQPPDQVIQNLAAELNREESAVRAAVDAVRGGPQAADILSALLPFLARPQRVRQVARYIRQHWAQLRAQQP